MSHLRTVFLSTIATLACTGAVPVAGAAAAQSSRTSTAGVASPTARAAARRRSQRSCRVIRRGKKAHLRRKGHVVRCAARRTRAHKRHASKSRAASSRAVRHGHARRRPADVRLHAKAQTHARVQTDASVQTRSGASASVAPQSGQSVASVLATPCANTELTPTAANLEAVDAATLCLVNQERARNNELPLQSNARLAQAAQGHSEEMVSSNYFAHISPSGVTPVARVQQTGYVPNSLVGYTLGENIAWGTLELSTPAAIVAAWIASPDHLANILFSAYRDTAIGVAPAAPASLAEGQQGAVYSQEFGVIAG